MSDRRSYGDSCGIARGLDLVGSRWALLVVRELVLGPKRFTDLRAGLPGMSAEVLALRLRELEEAGVLHRATLPPPAGTQVYELTEWGAELEPALVAFARWGSRAPFPPDAASLGPDALVLALRTLFAPDSAGREDMDLELVLELGRDRIRARVRAGELEVQRGDSEAPDARLAADPAVLTEVLWHGQSMSRAERDGRLTLTGSRDAARRFLRWFPAPEPARPA